MLVLGTGGTTDPVLLDETASRIWNGLNHWTTPAELTNQVHASFPTTDADIISEAVAMTLERLSGAGLLERE